MSINQKWTLSTCGIVVNNTYRPELCCVVSLTSDKYTRICKHIEIVWLIHVYWGMTFFGVCLPLFNHKSQIHVYHTHTYIHITYNAYPHIFLDYTHEVRIYKCVMRPIISYAAHLGNDQRKQNSELQIFCLLI